MQRARWAKREWLIWPSIVLILVALGIWIYRPGPFQSWLAGEGSNGPPSIVIEEWAGGWLAPMTPVGFLTLFPTRELVVLGALIVLLAILAILLFAGRPDPGTESWLTRTRAFHRLRISTRLRTLLLLIAIVGLELGWEIVAWKNWRLRKMYRNAAWTYFQMETGYRHALKFDRFQLDALESDSPTEPWSSWTPAARAAHRAYYREVWSEEASKLAVLVDTYSRVRREYVHAAANPSQPFSPHLPPLQSESIYDTDLYGNDSRRALTKARELIRRYPDLEEAHERLAWHLATCPDPKVRDGKLALAEAKRAYELTDGHAPDDLLSTMAAAHAELGDFAGAVKWEQQHLEREQRRYDEALAASGGQVMGMVIPSKPSTERLNRYRAGQPYRTSR